MHVEFPRCHVSVALVHCKLCVFVCSQYTSLSTVAHDLTWLDGAPVKVVICIDGNVGVQTFARLRWPELCFGVLWICQGVPCLLFSLDAFRPSP